MSMTYHEAADIASRGKNFFAAFERIEEVLTLTIGAERVAKEAEERVQSAAAVANDWRRPMTNARASSASRPSWRRRSDGCSTTFCLIRKGCPMTPMTPG